VYGDLFQISRSTVPYEINMIENSMLFDLINECYSVILEQNTLNIVYTFYDSYMTLNGMTSLHFMNQVNTVYAQIIEAFDGEYIGVYQYKNKWYISTIHKIETPTNVLNCLITTLNTFNYTLDDFKNGLKLDLQYQFVLLCHELQNEMDYTPEFGKNYHKLVHVKTLNNCEELNLHLQLMSPIFHFEDKRMLTNLYYATRVTTLGVLDNRIDLTTDIKKPMKGLHVKILDAKIGEPSRSHYYFLPSPQLKPKHKLTNAHIDAFIEWYRRDKLDEYFRLYPQYYLVEINNETVDMITLIDTYFKIMASEVMELFKLLYNFKSRKFQSFLPSTAKTNIDIYTELCNNYPQYAKIITMIKQYIDKQKPDTSTNYILHIKDIYGILKNYKMIDYEMIQTIQKERIQLLKFLNELHIEPNYLSRKCKPDNLDKFKLFFQLII
jgi:hypothetical protein